MQVDSDIYMLLNIHKINPCNLLGIWLNSHNNAEIITSNKSDLFWNHMW